MVYREIFNQPPPPQRGWIVPSRHHPSAKAAPRTKTPSGFTRTDKSGLALNRGRPPSFACVRRPTGPNTSGQKSMSAAPRSIASNPGTPDGDANPTDPAPELPFNQATYHRGLAIRWRPKYLQAPMAAKTARDENASNRPARSGPIMAGDFKVGRSPIFSSPSSCRNRWLPYEGAPQSMR